MIVCKNTKSMLDYELSLCVYLHFDLVRGRFNALDIEWHLNGNMH